MQCLRDHQGIPVMVVSKKERSLMLLETVESNAILHGLQFYLQMGISNVSDCQVIVNDLCETQASLSP